jgi:hypothetical protein
MSTLRFEVTLSADAEVTKANPDQAAPAENTTEKE